MHPLFSHVHRLPHYRHPYQVLCGHKFSTPLAKYQGACLLDHMPKVHLVLQKLSNHLSKQLYDFHSHQQPPRVPVSTPSPTFGVVSLLGSDHSNGRAGTPHCSFSLYFPDGILCGVSFHRIACPVYVFFGKVPIKVFGLFLKLGCLSSYMEF